MATDFGLILHLLDAQQAVLATVTYDTDRVVSTGPIDVTVPLNVASSNTDAARGFVEKVKELSITEERGPGKLDTYDIEINLDSGEFTLMEMIKGEASDVQINFEWTYDIDADTMRVENMTAFDTTFAAYEAHVLIVEQYMDKCKDIRATK